MITYCDAFLFCIGTLDELGTTEQRDKLRASLIFQFLKACRNVTTHKTIVPAPVQNTPFERPTPRSIVDAPEGSSARLRVDIVLFRAFFSEAKSYKEANKNTLKLAEDYLQELEAQGYSEIFLDDVFREGLKVVADLLCIPLS